MTRLTLVCTGWKPIRRGTLFGFAAVHIELKMTIADVALHEKAGSRWAQVPGKPLLDRDGVALRDQATNRIRYVTLIEFDSPAVRAAFSNSTVAAVIAAYPDAFAAEQMVEVAS